MGKKRIATNPLSFKIGYFSTLSEQKLTPCEFRCLMILLEGVERTKSQLATQLNDSQQHVGKSMQKLEKLGIVVHTKTEGRNSFYKVNLDFVPNENDPNQLTIPT